MAFSVSKDSQQNDLGGSTKSKTTNIRGKKNDKTKNKQDVHRTYMRVLLPGEDGCSECKVKTSKVKEYCYPGVSCGHKSCIPEPIMTPKNMGWLWSLKDNHGVKINRDWKPGAIPVNVAAVMELSRAGKKYPGDRLHPERAKRSGKREKIMSQQ